MKLSPPPHSLTETTTQQIFKWFNYFNLNQNIYIKQTFVLFFIKILNNKYMDIISLYILIFINNPSYFINWYRFDNSLLETVTWVFVKHWFFYKCYKNKGSYLKLHLQGRPCIADRLMFAHYRFQVSSPCWSKLPVTRGLPFRLVWNSFTGCTHHSAHWSPNKCFTLLAVRCWDFFLILLLFPKKNTAFILCFYFFLS